MAEVIPSHIVSSSFFSPEFKTATFADGVDSITDLKSGMSLEGTVTNVAAFGAFVDIGVHQDGLVHVSQLADRFFIDPHEVVKAGDVVKVRVVEVDAPRKRIGLTMKKDSAEARDQAADRLAAPSSGQKRPPQGKQPQSASPPAPSGSTAFADALRDKFGKGR